MPYPALEITLKNLKNGGYCTNPVQPIIAVPVDTTATEGVLKVINPITPAIFLASTTATVTALSSLVNCSASITGSGSTISVTPTTASLPTSLTFELTDGNANTDSAELTLTVSAPSGSLDGSVVITDDSATDFESDGLAVTDTVAFDTITNNGIDVLVDESGNARFNPTNDPAQIVVAGDTFNYTINGGSVQTYTVGAVQ